VPPPAHRTRETYLEAAGIRDAGKAPLIRFAAGRTGTLTEKPMNPGDAHPPRRQTTHHPGEAQAEIILVL
jgi:hypothetical protein